MLMEITYGKDCISNHIVVLYRHTPGAPVVPNQSLGRDEKEQRQNVIREKFVLQE